MGQATDMRFQTDVASRPATSFDCYVEHPTPNGRAEVRWRLLPGGNVIEHSGSWSSTWRLEDVRLWLGWNGTDADPLRPDSIAGITPAGRGPGRRDRRNRVRIELRVPGSIGNVHWFAFATPYGPWNEVAGQAMVNWGELVAMTQGAARLEVRIVDSRGEVRRTSILGSALVDEARRAAGDAQAVMIAMVREFRERCQPYHGDPYNRDIVL